MEAAGLVPARQVHERAAEVIEAAGPYMRTEVPSALGVERLRAADRVIIVGEAQVPAGEGVDMERRLPARAPKHLAAGRGRMEFLRDDLAARVAALNQGLGTATA